MNLVDVDLSHWVIFNITILALLSADLIYSYYYPHKLSFKEALAMTFGWVSLAALFNTWIYMRFGKEAGLAFLTGYLLEEALSVDNLFVFLLIFSYFKVPDTIKHTVLFYGILGAIVMRAGLIAGGIGLVHLFHWAFYFFGAFLIYTGFKLAFQKEEEEIQHEKTVVYRVLSKFIPMTNKYHGASFFIKQGGKWMGTPLFVVLVMIETTDLIFALDSVPAILGITTDPFIVYTSNIFAILGLRSLFFVLEHVMDRFYLLHYALALILVFIGVKMLIADWVKVPLGVTFGVILSSIITSLICSLIWPKEKSIK